MGRFQSPGIKVFAVGKKHQGTAFAFPFAKRIGGHADRLGDVRAAQRDHVRVEFVERGKHGRVIDRERRLQEGGPGERDQPEAVSLQDVGKILCREFCAFKPVGSDVGRQHGARGVHREDQVAPFAFGLLHGVAVTRLGERDKEASQRAEDERELQTPLAETQVACKGRLQAGGHEALQQLAAAVFPPREKPGQHGEKRERPKPERRAPGHPIGRIGVHGSLLLTVCDSPTCASKISEPAATNHGKRSRY